MEELAADVSISARQLQRLFIEGTGLKFAQWRNRARLNQAIASLRTEDNLGTAMGASTFSTKQGLLRALSRECGTPIDQLTAEHAAALTDAQEREAGINPPRTYWHVASLFPRPRYSRFR